MGDVGGCGAGAVLDGVTGGWGAGKMAGGKDERGGWGAGVALDGGESRIRWERVAKERLRPAAVG